MSGLRTQGPFPRRVLPDLEGAPRPLAEAWAEGEALFLVGHHDCKTTRETLAYVDRIHRRRPSGKGVVAVLQDDVASASDLRAELGLALPVRLEEDPYPLAAELGLLTVPTLFLVDEHGLIAQTSEAFNRAQLEALAARMGVPALFTPQDNAPAYRPG